MKEYLVCDSVQVSTRKVLENGFLLCVGRVSKPGLYKYTPESIGIVSDKPVLTFYRPPIAVFDDKSMESFKHKPITDGHNGFIYATNSNQYMKGICNDVFKDKDEKKNEEYIGVKLLITDDEALREIDAGKKELSAGHRCRFVLEDGTTPDGQPYDGIQDMIEVNHIAIVEKGRAGHDCIIFDSDDINNNNKTSTNIKTKGVSMVKITIKGKIYEVADEAVEAIEQLKKENEENAKAKDQLPEIDQLRKELEETNKKRDELQAKIDALTGEKKELEEQLTADALDKAVEARLSVVSKAKALVPTFDAKGKNIPDIKREIVGVMCKDVDNVTKRSEAYIDGRFDSLAVKGTSAMDEAIKKHFTGAVEDGNEDVVEKKKKEKMLKDRDAWKNR